MNLTGIVIAAVVIAFIGLVAYFDFKTTPNSGSRGRSSPLSGGSRLRAWIDWFQSSIGRKPTPVIDAATGLDKEILVRVTEAQLIACSTIELKICERTLRVKLDPNMRGKKVRLPNAIENGRGHLFMTIHVLKSATNAAENS